MSPAGAVRQHLWRALLLLALVALSLLVITGLLPRRVDLASRADPAGGYEAALARWRRILAAEQGRVKPGNGSRLLTHGARTPRVYVLVHGITNSPRQWLELGWLLHRLGHNVLILRMPYHGLRRHSVDALKRLTAPELRAYADRALDIAAGLGDELVVAGISGGAVVAAWMAQQRADVRRALLLAPFFGLHAVPAAANTWFMNAFSRLPNINLQNPRELPRAWAYRGESSRGAVAFLLMGQWLVDEARQGRRPTAEINVLTTAADRVASNGATQRLLALWQQNGAEVQAFQFGPRLGIPHNTVDPSADPLKKEQVYARMLQLLGEPADAISRL